MRKRHFLYLFLVSMFALGVEPASATSFTLYDLGGDHVHVLGINGTGDVLLQEYFPCSVGGDNCYEEFSNGALSYRDGVLPANWSTDNGSPCAAPAGIMQLGRSVCNGGLQVIGGELNGLNGVWEYAAGAANSANLLVYGSGDALFLNSSGDLAIVDGARDEVYQVVAQTPEPSSLWLLATGALGVAGVARRRFQTR